VESGDSLDPAEAEGTEACLSPSRSEFAEYQAGANRRLRVGVTGGRDYDNFHMVVHALRQMPEDAVLVHGAAKGADSVCAEWWVDIQGREAEPHPADWTAPCRDTCKPGHPRSPVRSRWCARPEDARMTRPVRIQRRRTAGWRMPEGAVYVGRPTRWGNPFTVMNAHRQGWLVWDDRDRMGLSAAPTSHGYLAAWPTKSLAAQDAVRRYKKWLNYSQARSMDLVPLLAGRDLACWCPLDQPCHADVLLEVANR